MDTPNPYTVIATQIQRHGRFTESGGAIFCASGVCEWANRNESRRKRVHSHANHVAHYVTEALIEKGLLPPKEAESMVTGL